jgi:hypothetical protein
MKITNNLELIITEEPSKSIEQPFTIIYNNREYSGTFWYTYIGEIGIEESGIEWNGKAPNLKEYEKELITEEIKSRIEENIFEHSIIE